ncbi:hypothetical protein S777_23270 [Salmonella enterica subsp. enterica serovar Hvittingfoss]|nr:hypothetical protein [Salmonella enterica subsp. enterica serovar Hvittingfoss]EDP8695540.1 hypothetical protein [Salmonella enterica subsp. enterica serovar Hvittingfoss]EED2652933.1 hypothetical protein [Salmonella enterica subsp. enterica serovar Hvittingfoss]
MFQILKEMFVRLNKNEPHTTPQKAPGAFLVSRHTKTPPENKNATGAALAVFLNHLLRTVFKCRLNPF